MVEWLSVVDVIYEEVMIIIALSTGAAVIAYFRGILNRQKQNSKDIEELCKRTWRLERAFSLSLKLTAKLTRKAHANEPEIIEDVEAIEDMVNLILKDEEE